MFHHGLLFLRAVFVFLPFILVFAGAMPVDLAMPEHVHYWSWPWSIVLSSQLERKPAWTLWSCQVATWSLTLCHHPMACSLAASYEQALLRKCMASWPPGAPCPYQAAVSGFALAAARVFIHPGTPFKHVKWLDIYFLFRIMELAVPGAVFFPLLSWLNSRCACWCLFQVFRATVTEEN